MRTYNVQANEKDFFFKYLSAINGTLGLSHREITILGEFMRMREKYRDSPEIVFSSPIRKKVCEILGMSGNNLNNYVQILKSKHAILQKGDYLVVNDKITPEIADGKAVVSFCFSINGNV